MNPVVCNLCDTKLSYKRDLPKHQTTERCKSIHKFINDKINIHIIEKMELQNKNTILQNELSEIKKQLEEKDIKLKGKKSIDIDAIFCKDKVLYIIEYKQGDNLDTKKSQGEVESLSKISEFFQFYNIKTKY